jgi:hypothetical protein
MKTLKEIATFFGTDKAVNHKNHGEAHEYCDFYDYHLSPVRFEKLKIFEIGIFDGASLRTWEDYFPNSIIYGVDILTEPQSVLINEGRIKSYKLDAGDRVQLQEFIENHGPFDVVIDDGSHFTNHQWLSWELLSDKCKIFIWEDLHTSRMPHYMRGTRNNKYPLDYAKEQAKIDSNSSFIFDKNADEKHVTFVKINI